MKAKCQQCNGKGYHTAILRNPGGQENHGMGSSQIVSCMQEFCENGIVDMDKYHRSWRNYGLPFHLIPDPC
jgi:hypothetical protein